MDMLALLFSWVRTLGFLLLTPPVLGKQVPVKLVVFLSFPLALGVCPPTGIPFISWPAVAERLLSEAIQGLLWGGMVYLFWSALELSGQWSAQVTGGPVMESRLLPHLYSLIGWALFFELNLHQLIIYGLSLTYQFTPARLGQGQWISLGGHFFAVALLLALPFFLASLLVSLGKMSWQRVFGGEGTSPVFSWIKGVSFLMVLAFLPQWVGKVMADYFYWMSQSLEKM